MRRPKLWIFLFIFFIIPGAVILLMSLSDSDFFAEPNRIGVIEIRGSILSSTETLKSIKEFRKNPNVRSILVRIESPGGGVGASQEIYRELRRTIESKPVVASLGGIAASGGYYIASAANRIVANPGTITGSIGVISYFPNLQHLFDKIGYGTTIIKSGKFKDVGNPGREMTPQEREYLQGTIDEAYRQFVRDVALGRGLSEEKVRPVADGRIIMGENARELGLVDELGNFEDAVLTAASLGKIEGEPEVIYAKKSKRSLLDILIGSDVTERVGAYLEAPVNPVRYEMPSILP